MARVANRYGRSARRKASRWRRDWEGVVASAPDTGEDRRHPKPKPKNDDDNDKKPKSGGRTAVTKKTSLVVHAGALKQ